MFSLVTIVGQWTPDGVAAHGMVLFKRNAALLDTSTDEIAPITLEVARLDESGAIALSLIATDDPTTLPQGSSYKVTEFINGEVQHYYIVVPYLAAEVDLVDAPHVEPGPTLSDYVTEAELAAHAGTKASASQLGHIKVGTNLTIAPDGTLSAPAATGDKNYTHTQLSASATWVVAHSLGKKPSVHVEDSAGTEVVGNVHHDTINQLTLTFTAPFGGVAICN